ncbi:MAG: SDR family oxidoreductase [Proteobacteria bacterium]|nr:SDR family oxidoreductase [Pseudomonadota bacterium]MBU1387313.1 SDR family oxidoreductase [Pseudomonadota bacterium]MBU1544295.1 SDR family oxidoreductase [Pseudomonadota bacterium]MBU2430120.1 SDR family oxidoreductase [Pseudomonadota bacterium]MBU2479653.1 SDR family oxidoreductase [Pseudomonadota bacterium]
MNFSDEFKDKSVVITGAAGGLGKQTAIQYAAAGAKIVIGDLKIEQGQETAALMNASHPDCARFIHLDVTDRESVDALFKEAQETFGTVDILVNSAGISGQGFKPFGRIDLESWDLAYEVNVKGIVNCCKAALDIFVPKKAGKIVNVSSVSGRKPTPGLIHYAASKAAVNNLSQTLAQEVARFNINVNVVCPGWIWTPIYDESEPVKQMAQKLGKTPREFFLDMVDRYCPLKREQTEEDIANVILFLSSEAARNITGQAINVDGGSVMS